MTYLRWFSSLKSSRMDMFCAHTLPGASRPVNILRVPLVDELLVINEWSKIFAV